MLTPINFMKKISKFIVYGMVLSGILFLTVPRPSQAIWGEGDTTFDPVQDASGITQTIGQVTQIINEVQLVLKAFGLDVVIYKVSQQLSQKLIAKVLNSQNGGASGDQEPNFIKNFGQYFENIAAQQTNQFTNSLINNTNNPFAKNLGVSYSNLSASNTNLLNTFSLNKIPGVNWQQASGDVASAGNSGWDFYSQLALPQNTPVGSALIAKDQLTLQINQKLAAAKTELGSTGFTPAKGNCSNSPDLGSGNNSGFGNIAPCISSLTSIQTPSSLNQEQSNQSVVESFDRLRSADSFGKILFSTIEQIAEGLIKKGFSSLRSDGGAAQKLYGDPSDVAAIVNAQNGSWSSVPEQVVDLRNELDPAIQKVTDEITYINQTIDAIKQPLTGTVNGETAVVTKLEACVPGPDTGWQQRLQDYITSQTKDTQNRGGQDSDKGTNNTRALEIVRRETSQAVQEEQLLLSNPFLNIPAASEMNAALTEYYKTSAQFSELIDTLVTKRVVLSQLQIIRAEATALGAPGLVLFDQQYQALSPAQKSSLYTTLSPKILAAFPEYADPNNTSNLSALPADDPSTPTVDEHDVAMEKRILDEQWNEWETGIDPTKKQDLYAKYISVERDIPDSSTVLNEQTIKSQAQQRVLELKDILDDCRSIRTYVLNPTDPTAFVATLKSDRIKTAFSGPSILTAAANGIDFNNLNQQIMPEQEDLPGFNSTDPGALQLQVTHLASNASDLLTQDNNQQLFCRLTNYELIYWTPSPSSASLTGLPIGCSPTLTPDSLNAIGVYSVGNLTGQAQLGNNTHILGLNLAWGQSAYTADPTKARILNPSWYRITPTEILFNMTGQGTSGQL